MFVRHVESLLQTRTLSQVGHGYHRDHMKGNGSVRVNVQLQDFRQWKMVSSAGRLRLKKLNRCMNNMHPTHREQLGHWLNECGLIGIMVEVGCAHGGFAKIVLSQWQGNQYRMVDPWRAQDPSIYKERQEESWKYEHWFDECRELSERDSRVVVTRLLSKEASTLIQDGTLDCCYIDGNHSLEAVTEDLESWWPKVKDGGLFGGHDFYDATHSGHWCQVESAVKQWTNNNKLEFVTTPCSSWWIVKQ